MRVAAGASHQVGNLQWALGPLHNIREALIVVNVPRQDQIGITLDGLERLCQDLINHAASGMFHIAGKRRMMNRHDQGEIGIGSLQFALKPIHLVLMNFPLGLTDVGK
jgi:hypothetical protein